MSLKPIRVGFAWQTLTSENLGVVALAEANIEIARLAARRVGRELSCIEFCPSGPRRELASRLNCEIADPLSIKRMLAGTSRYAQQIGECDVILDIGAGDSFADIYGLKHLSFLSLSKWLGLRRGCPLILSPQTIGPFDGLIAKRLAHFILRRATKVFARDGLSMSYLRQHGLDSNADEVIDVAFRLPYAPKAQPVDGGLHVGLNVSGLLYNGGYSRNNQFGLTVDYPALIERLCERLTSQADVTLHLVPHVISDEFAVEDDYRVCQNLSNRFSRSVLAPRFEAPSEAKSYISGLHFFAGARMHACIGAFSSGVPVVPMAYSRKFNGLFQSLGYKALADMKRLDTDAALAAVMDGLERRTDLAAEVAQGNALAQSKLQQYEDYLVQLFGGLGGRSH
ncbi:MAG: polysaccharide pyruvyl transferase family protein [Rubrivivax sp.]|nr:polysaccharide pyruvyl transferase family protein [Rubrivivax sp.]